MVAIVVCEALAEEISIVAAEKGIPFKMHVIGSQCHRNPQVLRCKVLKAVDMFKEHVKVFIAYGGCSSFHPGDLQGVHMLNTHNCASALLGGDNPYQRMVKGSYFLTPYLAIHWMEYLLGKSDYSDLDPKTVKWLEKWFEPIDRLIKINIRPETEEAEVVSAKILSEVTKKPLVYVKGSLDLLRREYESFSSRHFQSPT